MWLSNLWYCTPLSSATHILHLISSELLVLKFQWVEMLTNYQTRGAVRQGWKKKTCISWSSQELLWEMSFLHNVSHFSFSTIHLTNHICFLCFVFFYFPSNQRLHLWVQNYKIKNKCCAYQKKGPDPNSPTIATSRNFLLVLKPLSLIAFCSFCWDSFENLTKA